MADSRTCARCRRVFEPKREHARFCSARCRVAWNREHWNRAAEERQLWGRENWGPGNPGSARSSALRWSVIAMRDAVDRMGEVRPGDRPQAFAVIGEAVWAVTIVDATLVRYHLDVYELALDSLPRSEQRLTEGTFGGLRFVRNRMGYYADHADFIEPARVRHASTPGRDDAEVPVTAWTWKHMPEPMVSTLPPRGQDWELTRYRAYADHLAGASIGDAFDRAAAFLIRATESAGSADQSA